MVNKSIYKKNIYIAYTGGTIGMRYSENGYVPSSGYIRKYLNLISKLYQTIPNFKIHEYKPLIDSSSTGPETWQLIACDIANNYNDYDGFVVLHGTDTMAFSASALSFLLENLSKPVILTGAQIPMSKWFSDGQQNLLKALFIAAYYPIKEVTLFFNNKLFRGNRVTKINANNFNGFDSPNLAPLLELDSNILNFGVSDGKAKLDSLKVHSVSPQPIGILTIYPGLKIETLINFLNQSVKALILRSYGVGNIPQNTELINRLNQANKNGTIVINITQCLSGSINMRNYLVGRLLASAGVISGADMTLEATLTKLYYLLSQDLNFDTIKYLLQTNLRGELTI